MIIIIGDDDKAYKYVELDGGYYFVPYVHVLCCSLPFAGGERIPGEIFSCEDSERDRERKREAEREIPQLRGVMFSPEMHNSGTSQLATAHLVYELLCATNA